MKELDLQFISQELTEFYKNCLESLPNELREYADTDPELPNLTPLKQFGCGYDIGEETTESELINCFKIDISNLIKYYVGVDVIRTVSYSPTISIFRDETTVSMVVRLLC